jgi:uncharacterized protein YceH (UPF0502 family)/quercetin dioxygenase-like cupin family protein
MTGDTPAPPRWRPLDPHQRRVLGVLIEKAKTTPAGYPMSINAIVTGCNQKNNRDPITAYDDFDVEKALGELQQLGVVKEIDWLGRVVKYKHLAYEWLGVRPVELAVLGELLLRGPQMLGELRSRAARMEPIEDQAALTGIVAGLLERRLMIELTPPGRGQVVSHNLYEPGELTGIREQHGGAGARPGPPANVGRAIAPGLGGEPRVIDIGTLRSSPEVATFHGAEHGASISFFMISFAAGNGPRRHRHAYEETFIILEGVIQLTAGGVTRTVGGGTVAVIPRGTWHEFKVVSETPARMINIHPVADMITEWAEQET